MEKTAERDGKVYEIGYLIVPSIGDEKVAGQVTRLKTFSPSTRRRLLPMSRPMLRPLAYTMVKKNRYGEPTFRQRLLWLDQVRGRSCRGATH